MQLHQLLPKRNPNSHKYDYGHVLVVGGSTGMSGAITLAANAALRSGCGLATVAVPDDIQKIVEEKTIEVMLLGLPSSNGLIHSSALSIIDDYIEKRKVNVVAIGCGMSKSKDTIFLTNKIIKYSTCPLVIDADGLNALAEDVSVLKECKFPIVLTPHLGEFCRISGYTKEELQKNIKNLAKEYALMYNVCLVVKGNSTIITNGEELFENFTGNPGMATAGSGDVLTGIIAALIAQGLSVLDAARLGVYIHGLAGDIAAGDKTEYSLIASDIIDSLPSAFKKMVSPG